jgi:hypothetical protein
LGVCLQVEKLDFAHPPGCAAVLAAMGGHVVASGILVGTASAPDA